MNEIKNTLEDICNGYPFEEFSLGRKLSGIFFHHLFNIDFLENSNPRDFKKIIIEHSLKDANASYEVLKKVFKVSQGINLPKNLDELVLDDRVFEFKTEGEYLRYLAKKPTNHDLARFSDETEKNVRDVKAESSQLLDAADKRKVHICSFDPRNFGGDGKIASVRRKPFYKILGKYLIRASKVFDNNYEVISQEVDSYFKDEELRNNFILNNGFDPIKDKFEAYRRLLFDSIKYVMTCNLDVQSCLDSKNVNWDKIPQIRNILSGLYLVDVGGFSYCGNSKESAKFETQLKRIEQKNLIEHRIKNNEEKQVSDLFNVYPFRGSESGEYGEGRIGTFDNLYKAMFGYKKGNIEIVAHPIYKEDEDQRFFRKLNEQVYSLFGDLFTTKFGYPKAKYLFRK